MGKFKHLHVPDHWEQYWTRYPQGYTILEALISWVSQVDKMVDNINDWNVYLNDFVENFDKRLEPTVIDMLHQMADDGTLDRIINENIFNDLNTKIDEVSLDLNSRWLNVRTFGAKGDGANDDLQHIKNAIAHLHSKGGGTLFFPKGNYMYSDSIELLGVKNIHLIGDNAILKPSSSFIHPFLISENESKEISENILLQGLTFDYVNNEELQNAHGVFISNSNNVTVRDCVFKNISWGVDNNGNDGIYIRGQNTNEIAGYYVSNVLIDNCKFYNISRQSVSIIQGEKITIQNCYMNQRRSGVDIEPNRPDEWVRDINVLNNYIDGETPIETYMVRNGVVETITKGIEQGYGLEVQGSNWGTTVGERINFMNNMVVGNSNTFNEYFGARFNYTKDSKFVGNIFKNFLSDNSDFVVEIHSNENVVVENNIIENYGDVNVAGFRMYNFVNGTFRDNKIRNGNGTGFSGGNNMQNFTFSGNQFIDCGSDVNPMMIMPSGDPNIDNIESTLFHVTNKTVLLAIKKDSFRGRHLITNCQFKVSGSGILKSAIDTGSNRQQVLHIINCVFDGVGANNETVILTEFSDIPDEDIDESLKIANCLFQSCKGQVVNVAGKYNVITNNRLINCGTNDGRPCVAVGGGFNVFKDNIFSEKRSTDLPATLLQVYGNFGGITNGSIKDNYFYNHPNVFIAGSGVVENYAIDDNVNLVIG